MLRISVNNLINLETDFLIDNLKGDFRLVFADGDLITNARETIYSHFAWEFHRKYPRLQCLKKHHVSSVIGKSRLGSNTHIKLLSQVLWDVYDTYTELNTYQNKVKFVDDLAKLAYHVTNTLYNKLTHIAEDSVASLDIVDFIQILQDPEIKSTLSTLKPTETDISKAYETLINKLKSDMSISENPLARGFNSRLVKHAQLLQCLGPRGFVTDIDSNQFSQPILASYASGLVKLYDSMIESRSASKALYFSKKDLQDSEYFSRKLQLLGQTIKNLHHGDCGSDKYLSWHIKPPTYENGEMTFPGDLGFLKGKYYLDETDNKLKVIRAEDKFLEGKTIKIRSVVAGCSHPDPYGVCSTCFGELANVIPEQTNIGQICTTTLTKIMSQAILSTKHLDASASVESIVVSPEDKRYLRVASSGNSYLLSDNLKGKNTKIMISVKEAPGLTDVNTVDDVKKLAMTRVSEIAVLYFVIDQNFATVITPVEVARGKRLGSLTYDALDYVKKHGWTVDDKDNFIIDLSHWDFTNSFVSLPFRHFNMSDVSQATARLIESNMTVVKQREEMKDPEAVLVELFDLVNSHVFNNLAVLEITLLGAMVISNENKDFRIPKSYTDRSLGASKLTIPSRSMGGAMAYENHYAILTSPNSFFQTNRPDHQFDVMLCPQEVLQDNK